jgi:colanic acid biosynthesis glycosyl transferase WcaI
MNVLLLTQWFEPEPSLKGLSFAKELKSLGHEVEVLTGFPNYPSGKLYDGYRLRFYQREVLDGIVVHRVPLYPSHDNSAVRRIANYLSFALSAAFIGPFVIKKPDAMFVYHPPASVGFPAIVIRWLRHVPFLYDINDLWPDTLSATGMLKNAGLLKIVALWCRFVYSQASRITVISPGFLNRVRDRGVPADKLRLVYNCCDDDTLKPGVAATGGAIDSALRGKFNVIFAGNMGKAQALDAVIDAAKIVASQNPRVQFVFVGEGVELGALKLRADRDQLTNVVFVPRQPVSEIGSVLARADVLLVHLKEDPLFRITIPSKTQAYLSAGRPILMGVQGDAADLVLAANAGISCEPENAEEIAAAVCRFAAAPEEELRTMGDNGRRYYEQHLTLRSLAAKIENLLQEMASANTRPVTRS